MAPHGISHTGQEGVLCGHLLPPSGRIRQTRVQAAPPDDRPGLQDKQGRDRGVWPQAHGGRTGRTPPTAARSGLPSSRRQRASCLRNMTRRTGDSGLHRSSPCPEPLNSFWSDTRSQGTAFSPTRSRRPSTPWPGAASMISLAAASTATLLTIHGSCPTSRRWRMTMRGS